MKCSKWIAVIFGFILIVTFVGTFWSHEETYLHDSFAVFSDMLGLQLVQAKETTSPAGVSPYEMNIKPLTTIECGQCHFSVFKNIKNSGGKHQIDCVRCHKEYHVYNPRKQNYDEIMPSCAWCHQSSNGGAFHGNEKAIVPCLNCHKDPHKPLVIPMAEIDSHCAVCHKQERSEIKDFPSMHTTEVACAGCHEEKHGFIPECSVCHESHSPAVEMASKDCMTCHPVHKPTEISYDTETQSTICAGCHGGVYDMLKENVTAHTDVTCADCHPSHAEIPLCARCHGEPHPASMNATKCGECHGIAHDLAM